MSSFTIHNISEKNNLNPMYGMDTYRITKNDIDALLSGKILYSDENGEYATLIVLESEESAETGKTTNKSESEVIAEKILLDTDFEKLSDKDFYAVIRTMLIVHSGLLDHCNGIRDFIRIGECKPINEVMDNFVRLHRTIKKVVSRETTERGLK